MPRKVVVDTSVLIAFEKLDLLSLLCDLYEEVWVAEAVWKEFGGDLGSCFRAKKASNRFLISLLREMNLGNGECETMVLAHENGLVALIDDLRARKIAKKLGLKVSGTLGVLIKLKERNLIESAYKEARKLKDLGFYISENLLQELKHREKI